jgi:hypothetical protein
MTEDRQMTILQRMVFDAEIRRADKAFLASIGIVPNFEPEPTEKVNQESECLSS